MSLPLETTGKRTGNVYTDYEFVLYISANKISNQQKVIINSILYIYFPTAKNNRIGL